MEISIISMVLTAVLVLICLFLVLSPFFKWDAYIQFQTKSHGPEASDKEALLTTLNEIEFEHKMGKLSDSDFYKLKKQYETEVAKILKAEEQNLKTAEEEGIMAEVEREIEAALNRNRLQKEAGK
jgi:hypothetical protein